MITTKDRDVPCRPRHTRYERIARSARCGPVLAVRGPLDSGGFREFSAELMQLAASGGASLTVDLREVDSVDAAAIGALLRAGRHCRARGVKLRVVYASGPVGRLLSLAAVSIPPVETPGENAPAAGGRELAAVAS